ncbi:6142_t:CDS:2 [Entrophospora sp. SA101]|nr:6142_t:CDS:2 [Entrophospora sp. SA101]
MYKYSASTSPTLSARTSHSLTHSIRTAEATSGKMVILTRADIRASLEAYEQLLASAKIYRNQMIALSQATANFGQSLERIARCKGALEDGPNFQAAAGLHFLMSNHYQLLGDTFYKNFEIPLLENLDTHKSTVIASEENYDNTLTEMSNKIKETEAENLRIGLKRQRDLTQFRRALQDLTRQVEDLDRMKTEYHRQTLETEQNNLKFILSKVSTVIKAEVDIFDRISSKGLADPLLDTMVTQGTDPFCTYQTADQFSEIFSVLPPVPIINHTADISSTTTTVLNSFSNDFQIYSDENNYYRPQLSTQKEIVGDDDEAQGTSKVVMEEEEEETEAEGKESKNNFGSENTPMLKDNKQNTTIVTSIDINKSSKKSLSSSPNNINNNIAMNPVQHLQSSSLVNSVISPFVHQHFDKSNKSAINIPDDADILNNKEFKFGSVDDSRFGQSLTKDSPSLLFVPNDEIMK